MCQVQMFHIHDCLRNGGDIPVAGAVVSIPHAVISTAQIIAALAVCILSAAARLLTCDCSRTPRYIFHVSVLHLYLGVAGLIYSTLNILTLGICCCCAKAEKENVRPVSDRQIGSIDLNSPD